MTTQPRATQASASKEMGDGRVEEIINGVAIAAVTGVIGAPFYVGFAKPESYTKLYKLFERIIILGGTALIGFVLGGEFVLSGVKASTSAQAAIDTAKIVSLAAVFYLLALIVFEASYVSPVVREKKSRDLSDK